MVIRKVKAKPYNLLFLALILPLCCFNTRLLAEQQQTTGSGELQSYFDLLEQEQFAVVKEQFETPLTPEQREGMQPQKLLYRDYNESMYADDMFDEFGEYRFDEADRRRQLFIQQYGIDALNSVEMVIGERRADEPLAVKMLRQARKVLQPYWDIERRVWSQFPPELKQISDQVKILERTDPISAKRMLFNYPQIVFARRQIALFKRQLKASNIEIAKALEMFYRY